MRKITYLAVLEPTGTGYSVYFPDLQGCISIGKDIEDAVKMAKEALQLHIYGMEKDGEKLPLTTKSISHEEISGCVVVPITIYPDVVKHELDNRRIKTNVTIPSWLKDLAELQGINYSRLLEASLMEILEIKDHKS